MKLKVIIFIFILIQSQTTAFGQYIGFEEIDTTKISPWSLSKINEYQGVYHFGESEGESSLILICSENSWYAQIVKGSWTKDENWIFNYINLKNIRIEGNKFYSDKTNGEFVIYDDEQETVYGLKVLTTWDGNNGFEIGYKYNSVTEHYEGRFPQTSFRILNRAEVNQLSKYDLRIMLNEIYARYGYIFKEGSEMDLYFSKQDWYRGDHKNVDNFLTDLEKENIKLIKQNEK
jgi:hypothetical protein